MIRSIVVLMLCALNIGVLAQTKPKITTAATKSTVDATTTRYRYTVKNSELTGSTRYGGALNVEFDAHIFNVVCPTGWAYDTDFETFITWFVTDGADQSAFVAPGETASGFGFDSDTRTSSNGAWYVAAAHMDAPEGTGTFNGARNLTVPLRSLQLAPISNPVYGNGEASIKLVLPFESDGSTPVKLEYASCSGPAQVVPSRGQKTTTLTVIADDVAAITMASITATYPKFAASSSIAIQPNPLLSLAVSPDTFIGGDGSTVTGTVALKATVARDITILLSSSRQALAGVPTSVIVKAGTSQATFSVTHSAVVALRSVKITAVLGSVTKYKYVNVKPSE